MSLEELKELLDEINSKLTAIMEELEISGTGTTQYQ